MGSEFAEDYDLCIIAGENSEESNFEEESPADIRARNARLAYWNTSICLRIGNTPPWYFGRPMRRIDINLPRPNPNYFPVIAKFLNEYNDFVRERMKDSITTSTNRNTRHIGRILFKRETLGVTQIQPSCVPTEIFSRMKIYRTTLDKMHSVTRVQVDNKGEMLIVALSNVFFAYNTKTHERTYFEYRELVRSNVTHIALNSDETLLAIATADGRLRVWNYKTRKFIFIGPFWANIDLIHSVRFAATTGDVYWAAVLTVRRSLIIISISRTTDPVGFKMSDLHKFSDINCFEFLTSRECLVAIFNRKSIVTFGLSKEIPLCNAIKTISTAPVSDIFEMKAAKEKPELVMCAKLNRPLHVTHAHNVTRITHAKFENIKSKGACWSSDDKLIFTIENHSHLVVWDSVKLQPIKELIAGFYPINSIKPHPIHPHVVLMHLDNQLIYLWNAVNRSKEPIEDFDVDNQFRDNIRYKQLVWSGNGTMMVAINTYGRLALFNLSLGLEVIKFSSEESRTQETRLKAIL